MAFCEMAQRREKEEERRRGGEEGKRVVFYADSRREERERENKRRRGDARWGARTREERGGQFRTRAAQKMRGEGEMP